MKSKTAVLCGLVAFILAGFCMTTAKAQSGQSALVFRIGTFDRSSAEFAGGAPKLSVNFIEIARKTASLQGEDAERGERNSPTLNLASAGVRCIGE